MAAGRKGKGDSYQGNNDNHKTLVSHDYLPVSFAIE
jgi:hypothetical protein